MNRIKIIIAWAVISLILPGYLKAQERIIEMQNLNDVSSIIREVNDTCWLVCNNSNGQSRFTRTFETQATSPQLLLDYVCGADSMCVRDFEIFRDTVYFCGQAWTEEVSFGFWGFFPLTGFPFVNVSFHTGALPDGISKLEVFSVDTTTVDLHVVMLGFYDPFGPGEMIDMVRTAPNTYYLCSSRIFDTIPSFLFTDVEVTDQHIAVSSTVSVSSVLFIDKPLNLYTSIFTGNAINYTLPVNVTVKQIEYCGNNLLVAAASHSYSGEIHLLTFSGASPQYHFSIKDTRKLDVVDLKYNWRRDNLDLLTNSSVLISNYVDSTVIFHLNPSVFYSGGPIFCHKYAYERLNSIAWISSKNYKYVASGHDENDHHLRLYTYQYNFWGNCTEWLLKEAVKLEFKKDFFIPSTHYFPFMIHPWNLQSYDLKNPLKNVCK